MTHFSKVTSLEGLTQRQCPLLCWVPCWLLIWRRVAVPYHEEKEKVKSSPLIFWGDLPKNNINVAFPVKWWHTRRNALAQGRGTGITMSSVKIKARLGSSDQSPHFWGEDSQYSGLVWDKICNILVFSMRSMVVWGKIHNILAFTMRFWALQEPLGTKCTNAPCPHGKLSIVSMGWASTTRYLPWINF